jgi:hypothetical protein
MLLAHVANAQYNDPKPEFRGLVFGDSLSRLADAHLLYKMRDSSMVYELPDEDLTVSGARVKSIRYFFYKGAFYAATIEIPTTKDAMAILAKLKTAHGYPQTAVTNRYAWSTGTVHLTLDMHPTKGTATLRKEDLQMVRHIYDVKSQREQAAVREKAEEADEDDL